MASSEEKGSLVGFMCRKAGTSCCICGGVTEIGAEIYPIKGDDDGAIKWCHLACYIVCKADISKNELSLRPLCKHFIRLGTCRYGASCFFSHDEAKAAVARAKLKPKRTWNGKRKVVRNESRAGVFRRFLIDEFGLDTLKSGGCIDVAGGKGDLGFQLVNLNGIAATVIDPRPLQLRKFSRCLQRGMYHRNKIFSSNKYVQVPYSANAAKSPKHMAICLDYALLSAAGVRLRKHKAASKGYAKWRYATARMHPDELAGAFAASAAMKWSAKGLHEDGSGEADDDDDDDGLTSSMASMDVRPEEHGASVSNRVPFCIDETLDGEPVEITTFKGIVDTVKSASVVSGMHPDQGTEIAVDIGLLTGKAFAVVPCCVYAKSFPGRYLNDGTPVGTHEEFLTYLVEKDPMHVKTASLDFEGKNVVVYGHPRRIGCIHFAEEFVDTIQDGKKKATTRWLQGERESFSYAAGDIVNARTGPFEDPEIFAQLEITIVEERAFDDIDDELAAIETYKTAQELKDTLTRFYPSIRSGHHVTVIHFEVVKGRLCF